jgi:hypothetical protein
MKEKEKKSGTPAVVRYKDRRFQVSVYNGYCAGLHNKKLEDTEH